MNNWKLFLLKPYSRIYLLIEVRLLQLIHSRVVLDLRVRRVFHVHCALLAFCLTNASIPIRLRHSAVRVSLDVGRLRFAERRQILDVIVHILDGKRQDLDAHAADIRSGHFADERRKLVAIFVHLFDGKSSCLVGKCL